MRALLPTPADLDPAVAYAPPDPGPSRPFVRANMITSLDGAVSVNGRSGVLGGPPDRRIFQILRSWADVVLVGAGTAKAEAYGPARLEEDLRRRREERGRPPVPPIAVVTRSANLDWTAPLFTQAEARPIVLTSGRADDAARRRGSEVADVLVAGDEAVDPVLAVNALYRSGFGSILVEGGPALNADVVGAGLLDELCLTVAPCIVGGNGPRVLAGPELLRPLDVRVIHLLEEDGFLFFRLGVRVAGPG